MLTRIGRATLLRQRDFQDTEGPVYCLRVAAPTITRDAPGPNGLIANLAKGRREKYRKNLLAESAKNRFPPALRLRPVMDGHGHWGP